MSSEMVMMCPTCSGSVFAEDRFCEACGAQLIDDAPVAAGDHREVDAGVAAGVTDRGLVHRRNEDALNLQVLDGLVFAVVCDGVSSSVAADAAARVGSEAAGRALGAALASADRDPESAMLAAIGAAQRAVLRVPWAETRALAAPSCTFVAAIWDGHSITVCGIGDSRAYWIGETTRCRLTLDDSWAQEQVDAGLMSERAAEADPNAHMITRWLGADAPDEPYHVESFEPAEPGRVVVCSDGLWNYAPTATEVAELVTAHPDGAPPIAVARALVDAAIAAGGHDNITVAVIDVAPATDPKPTESEEP